MHQQMSLTSLCYDCIQDNLHVGSFDEVVLQNLPTFILGKLAYHLSPYNLLRFNGLWKSRGITNEAVWLGHLQEIGCSLLDSVFRHSSNYTNSMSRRAIPQDKFTKWILGKTLHSYLMEDPNLSLSITNLDKVKLLHTPLLCSSKTRQQYMENVAVSVEKRDLPLQLELCARLTSELSIFDSDISSILGNDMLLKALCSNLKTLTVVRMRQSPCPLEHLKQMLVILTEQGSLENLVVSVLPSGSQEHRSNFSFSDFILLTSDPNHLSGTSSIMQIYEPVENDMENISDHCNYDNGLETCNHDDDLYNLAVSEQSAFIRGGIMNPSFIKLSSLDVELLYLNASELDDLSKVLPRWQSLRNLHILLDDSIIHNELSLQQFVTAVGNSSITSLSLEMSPGPYLDTTLRREINLDFIQRIMKECGRLQSLDYQGAFGSDMPYVTGLYDCDVLSPNIVSFGICEIGTYVDGTGRTFEDGSVFSRLLQQTGPGLQCFKIESQGNRESCNIILQTIAGKRELEYLRYKSRNLHHCVSSVTQMITDLHNLKILDLPECNIDDLFFTPSLIEALAKHPSLEEILLRNNKLGDGALRGLLQVFRRAHAGEHSQTKLHTLDISFSKRCFTEECLTEFARGLEVIAKYEKRHILYRLAYIQCHWKPGLKPWQLTQQDIRQILLNSVQFPYGSLLPTEASTLFGEFLSQM
ncbi:uncharacterized protein LOC106165043 [Lingula anatina]|uniref:Uncharacterized protein LOC106165043 n=1 Tax=Lingula anatina TaxID=7574 RepID=A0A1S3IL15_LINAN|nr:uncharacterized protein LOC106165043 [Lingula anatina]|eukprot:XP_013398576.1 uncharacterized protein LOC106165043 [Lingula anatina]